MQQWVGHRSGRTNGGLTTLSKLTFPEVGIEGLKKIFQWTLKLLMMIFYVRSKSSKAGAEERTINSLVKIMDGITLFESKF
ncbi:hypothetical protein Tco_1570621 [Tanacetum coccineum]